MCNSITISMKNILFLAAAISLTVISCKKDEKPTYLENKEGISSVSAAPAQPSKTALLEQTNVPVSTAQTGTTMATGSGMNPAHGQPGHRCDIPVGQPLGVAAPQPSANGARTQNITVPANNTIEIDPNAVSPGKITVGNAGNAVKTAPGMNPPHGQPGHRCDIAVGQPLSSKSAPAPAPAPQPTPAPQAVANVGPKPKINPAHGEPWHDCGKPVGEAL